MLVLVCILLLASAWSPVALSKGSASEDQGIADNIAQLKSQVSALQARNDLDSGVRTHAVNTYQQAISALEAAQSDREQSDKLSKAAADAPSELEKVQSELHDLEKPQSLDDVRSMSSSKLSTMADSLRSSLGDTQSKLANLRDQLTRMAQRPDAARASLAQARNQLQSLTNESAAGQQQPSAVNDAQQALQSAKRKALNAKIDRLQEELSSLDPRERLLEAKRSLAEARVARYNESLAAVETALGRKQNESAQSLKSQSEGKLSELRSSLKPISQAAQRNVDLSNELTKVTQQTEALARQQVNKRKQVDDLERRLNLVQRQLEIGGGSVALGDVLRSQKRKLASPSLPFLSSDEGQNAPDVAAAELQRFQLQQSRSALEDPGALADQMAEKAGVKLDDGQRRSLINLLKQRRSIVDLLINAESRYVDIGRDLGALSKQYQQTLSSFNRLLDERLFWLPSFHPLKLAWLAQVAADLPWALNPGDWEQAARAFGQGIIARPFVALAVFFAVALLVGVRRGLRQRLSHLREPVGNVTRDTFWLTLRASLVTVLLALPSVILLFMAGYLMRQAPNASRFTQAAAAGVQQLGVLVFFIEPFVQVCRNNGLADGHFHWSAEARQGLHRSLRWLLLMLAIPTLLVGFTEAFDDDSKRQTLGRAAFMCGSLMIAGFSWRLLHPRYGVLANVTGSDNKASHWRLGYLWLPLAFGGPIALCGLAAWGYYYTALQVESRFFYSAALLGVSMIFYSLIVRWLTVAERRLALARARRKREEAREARATREAASAAGEGAPDNLDNLEIDLVQISEQTRGLIQVFTALLIGGGLWLIWSDMLPALQLLNDITLWHHTAQINGKTQLANVTLGALLLALGVGAITALAGRNLPGFLEITILRRFSMDPGSRYAMATLFQYAIVIIGLLVAVGIIGLRWSSIQWLVAALGVGLGFGLQEIFANFVSGIVILFERPVRVGDTVTVGALTGTVSRIRIRATTIIDWDNKEVVIPNKTFITETVINWTLSDDITRLIVRVGIAYDADTELAEKLIMQSIKAESVALEEPAPSVFLVGLGDSAVLYEARVFYHGLYNLLPLQHALYKRIHAAFGEHQVEITFPQRDLHLRSVDSSVARIFSDQGDQGEVSATPAQPQED